MNPTSNRGWHLPFRNKPLLRRSFPFSMRWRGRSGSRDLNAIYNMYSFQPKQAATRTTTTTTEHGMAEKGKEVVTVHAQQWPLSGNGERPSSPNTLASERPDGTNSSSQGSYSRHQRRAQALAEQKRKRKRRWMIILGSIAAIVIVGLAVGLGVGLSMGAKEAEAKRLAADGYYIPPVVHHTTPENDLMAQMFEWNIPKNASHWNMLARQLPNLKVLGIKNIWIPPAYKNANRSAIGYDVYDLWDLGEFNTNGNVATNMGTKKQLEAMAKSAKENNIGLIFDAVLNQRSGADDKIACPAHSLNATDRLQVLKDNLEIEAFVKFDYKARNGKYSTKTWDCNDFTAVAYDAATGDSSVVYKIDGTDNDFEDDVSNELGNYDFLSLSDVAYKNPSVRADVLAWVKWINELIPMAGFRLDAAKHISRGFIKEVISTMAATNNNQDKWFAAEFFTDNLQSMKDYIDALDNRGKMFDTILLSNFAYLSQGLKKDVSLIFNNTFLKDRPDQTVSFVTTHDTQIGQSLDVLNVQTWFLPLAYATILLRQEGLPCLFFGDIYGTYDDYASTFTFASKRQMIANMAVARKYWAYGTQRDYFSSNTTTTTTVGWTREGIPSDRPDGLAVVLNISPTMAHLAMNVGAQHAGETWYDITSNIITQTVTIDADGAATFPCRGDSASVWINRDAVEGRDSLNQFDGDFFHIAPYEIGHATIDYETGGELGSQRQIAEGISQYRLDGGS